MEESCKRTKGGILIYKGGENVVYLCQRDSSLFVGGDCRIVEGGNSEDRGCRQENKTI